MSDPVVPDLNIPENIISPIDSILTTLVECVCATLTAYEVPTCCCCVYPGQEVPWDFCETDHISVDGVRTACEGMTYVNIRRTFPTKRFPYENAEADPCDNSIMAADIRVGVLRCAPSLEDGATLPPCDDLTQSALGILKDRALVHAAVRCCLMDQLGCDEADVKLGAWRTLGPGGGCTGGELALIFAFNDCRC